MQLWQRSMIQGLAIAGIAVGVIAVRPETRAPRQVPAPTFAVIAETAAGPIVAAVLVDAPEIVIEGGPSSAPVATLDGPPIVITAPAPKLEAPIQHLAERPCERAGGC